MLSFRFDLTSRQIDSLLQIYSGSNNRPDNEGNILFDYPGHMTTCDALRRKGLVKHVNDLTDVEKRKFLETREKIESRSPYIVTERGRQIALLILEDAEKILKLGALAKKRGVA